jgi:hypothetical protein
MGEQVKTPAAQAKMACLALARFTHTRFCYRITQGDLDVLVEQ